jgi:multidrug efflux pump subunit AcrB
MSLRVRGAGGDLVPLGEIARIERTWQDRTIYHKDLRPLIYVTGEPIGISPIDALLDAQGKIRDLLPPGYELSWSGEGEWKITVEVFRDLGLAFAAALVMIYILLVAQTGSMSVPLVIMLAIPLTMIGVFPGFFLLNLLFASPVGHSPNPIFFTAPGMIGLIALAGIVVRNSIILIDFIEVLRRQGRNLQEAIVEAGATRLRPILLTAGAALFGAWIIILDPIFSGLAWAFIFGIFASTGFTLLVVPTVYMMLGPAVKEGSSETGEEAPEG